jgi:hypothetical protein
VDVVEAAKKVAKQRKKRISQNKRAATEELEVRRR